jgi:hypothetical protein
MDTGLRLVEAEGELTEAEKRVRMQAATRLVGTED